MSSAGALLFNKKIPYVMEMEAVVNGIKFTVHGKGTGDATTGAIEAKYVCTTGELPVPWASILSTMAYGVQCFTKYPDNIKDFYKSAMPEGYTQERTISFENDGTFKTRAVVTFERGSVYNRVTLTGEGFKKDGHVLRKNYTFTCPSNIIYVLPDKANNGIRCAFNKVYELKGDAGHQVASHSQVNRPLANGHVDIPIYHHLSTHNKFSKDQDDKRDHMCLTEVVRAVDLETYQ